MYYWLYQPRSSMCIVLFVCRFLVEFTLLFSNLCRVVILYYYTTLQVKVYYEDFSNTTQTKWVDVREDYIRQFGLYQKGMINEDTKKTKKTTSKHTTVEDCSEEDSVDSAALESEEEEEEEKERTAQSAQKRKKKQHPSSKLKKRKRNNASSHSSSL